MTPVAIILGGPFAAMVILGLLPPLRRSGRPAAYFSIACIGAGLIASILLFLRFNESGEILRWEFLWAPFSQFSSIHFGILIDGLSASMLVVVSLVAFVV